MTSGKKAGTHWLVFMKPHAQVQAGPAGVMAGIAPATDCWAETTGKE